MSQISLHPDGTVNFIARNIVLGKALPVLNGVPLPDAQAQVLHDDPGHFALSYTSPAFGRAAFGLEALREGASWWYLKYWVEELSPDVPLDSMGMQFTRIENVRAFLRQGYTSWDGSYYVAVPVGEEDQGSVETGYAMTQLLPATGEGSLVMGFDRHDRFQHTFTWAPGSEGEGASLTVLTLWDRKDRAGIERCESERLYVFEHPEAEEGLREWARLVGTASPYPPRSVRPIIGWCSWYNLYAAITEENVLEHLRGTAEVVERERLPMWLFQIDDGFTPEMGDWLLVKPQFPRGMKPLLDDIRAAGFTPGLWIAPFMVGNRSRLYREHPDWVVKDRLTGGPLVKMRLYGEFRWHKRSEEYYVLDTTHPDAFDYLRRVFRTWRHEWGCEYFKTDFMEFGSAYGPDRAAWHAPGMTRIEIWQRVAIMIREEIGDATWLGCGCPLWPAVGLVDAMRVGRDVGVQWSGERSAGSLLRDLTLRNFANGVLWQADPDSVLLRERFHHLSEAEIRSLAIYAGMSGGVMTTGDALHELSPGRLALWKLLLTPEPGACRYPFLGESAVSFGTGTAGQGASAGSQMAGDEALLIQLRVGRPTGTQGRLTAVFIFNTGDTPTALALSTSTLGLAGPQSAWDYVSGRPWPEPVEDINVHIAPHDGILLFLSPQPITASPDRLP